MGVPDKSNPEVAVRYQLLVLLVEELKKEGFKKRGVRKRRSLEEEGEVLVKGS
jgi:hypothetical protein